MASTTPPHPRRGSFASDNSSSNDYQFITFLTNRQDAVCFNVLVEMNPHRLNVSRHPPIKVVSWIPLILNP